MVPVVAVGQIVAVVEILFVLELPVVETPVVEFHVVDCLVGEFPIVHIPVVVAVGKVADGIVSDGKLAGDKVAVGNVAVDFDDARWPFRRVFAPAERADSSFLQISVLGIIVVPRDSVEGRTRKEGEKS